MCLLRRLFPDILERAVALAQIAVMAGKFAALLLIAYLVQVLHPPAAKPEYSPRTQNNN